MTAKRRCSLAGPTCSTCCVAILVAPLRVVDIKDIPAYRQVVESADGVLIGAAVTLDEVAASPLLSGQHALRDVLDEIQAIQVRASGTLAGDLCLQPRCWYYRSGFGLLARQDGESLVEPVGTSITRFSAIVDRPSS